MRLRAVALACSGLLWLVSETAAQSGSVLASQKISELTGHLTPGNAGGALDDDLFGSAVANLGDLDGDGTPDLAVGAPFDDDGRRDAGAVHIVFLNRDGTVKARQKISELAGGLAGMGSARLSAEDSFGFSVAGPGDIDGDGIPDMAVGAPFDDEAGNNRGAIHVLFLTRAGTVKAWQKIGQHAGHLTPRDAGGVVNDFDDFGFALAGVGDVNGDRVPDLAVGAPFHDDGGTNRGAVYVLLLSRDGTVAAQQKLSQSAGNLRLHDTNASGPGLLLGASVAGLGDVDGDGSPDIAVGAPLDDDGGTDKGAVYVLFLDGNGAVKAQQKISDVAGNLSAPGGRGSLRQGDRFGAAVASLGDADGDGSPDLAVGAPSDDDGGVNKGALYALFLSSSGTVKGRQKISELAGKLGAGGPLHAGDAFATSLASLGDLRGDGTPTIAVGAPNDDDGGLNNGAAYVLFLDAVPIADAGEDREVCSGGSVTVGGDPTGRSGNGALTYRWSPGTGLSDPAAANPTATPTDTTEYAVVVHDADGDVAEDRMVITLHASLIADAGSTKEIGRGARARIGGSPSAKGGAPPYTFRWTPADGLDDAALANPTASPGLTTTYALEVTDVHGCKATDRATVTLKPPSAR